MLVAHELYAHQPMKMPYGEADATVPTKGPWSTSCLTIVSIPLLPLVAERTSASRCPSTADIILRMPMTLSLYNVLWMDESWVVNVKNRQSRARDSPHTVHELGMKSASASVFGLESSGTWSWAPICYRKSWLFNDILIFGKLFYWCCSMLWH
jgi:hypothetical protein